MNNNPTTIFILVVLSFQATVGKSNCIIGSVNNASMPDCSDGAINITVAGGFAPYTFQWIGSGNFSSTSEDIVGLSPGTYSVTVSDDLCGTATATFQVNDNSNSIYIAGKTNIFDCGSWGTSGDGSIDLVVPNGFFSYTWSGPNGFTASTQDISELTEPGDYHVTVTNSSGCTVVLSENICCCSIDPDDPNWEPPSSWKCTIFNSVPPMLVSGEVTSPITHTSANGSVNLTVSGGTGTRFFTWTGPIGFMAHTEDISGLNPGYYCVTVSDGCYEETKCFVLVVCSESTLAVSGTVTNTCQGLSFGAINITATGGTTPYKYNWSNNATTEDLSNLSSGQYCVTVKDASGCTRTACFTVGLNTLTYTNDNNPCGITTRCNGTPVGFQPLPVNCYYDNPFECTEYNCYCSSNGALEQTGNSDYLDVYINTNNCTIIGVCPGGGTEIASNGTFDTRYIGGQTCATCFWCAYVEGCYFAEYDYFHPTHVEYIQPPAVFSYLPQCSTGCGYQVYCGEEYIGYVCSECFTTDTIIAFRSDLKIGELYRTCQDSGLIANSTKLLLPEGIDKDNLVADYINYLSATQDSLRRFAVFTREEIGEIMCENRDCQVIFQNGGSGMKQSPSEEVQNVLNVNGLYPNPSTGKITIELECAIGTKSKVTLSSPTDRLILTLDKEFGKGLNVFSLDLKDLPHGVYMIEITDSDGNSTSHRVVKSK
ncbi:MAG: T9SS type A sorting domain-containing protein [Saprospiraceae bacterium]